MTPYVDLHAHSTASDGTLSPTELARLAKRCDLAGFALTDHDTIGGLAEASAEAQRLGLEFVPGIEISCTYPLPGTMHLLGYYVDPTSSDLASLASQLIDMRNNRNPRIVQRLNELGVAITMEEVEAQSGGTVVGRPHIAAVLVKKGYVSSTQQAFDKYLGQGGLAYFDKERLTPRQAMDLVLGAKGLPVLAHPVQLRTENDAQLRRVLKDLLDLGLRGIEVIHSDHTAQQMDQYSALADEHGLLKTGGSDFHGDNKHDICLGQANGRRVPREFMDKLKEAKGKLGI